MSCNRMRSYFFTMAIALTGCGDPPLLTTPLPNGYAMNSNGGSYAYVMRPDGQRMADYFGILDNGRQQWCEGFAWHGYHVICELEVSSNGGAYLQGGYFLLNAQSGEAHVLSSNLVEKEWKLRTGVQLPVLRVRYEVTEAK